MTAPTRVRLGDGLAYEPIPGVFAAVTPACPRCPWRGQRPIAAGTFRWRAWLALDISKHDCPNRPDQEKPS